MDSLTRILGSLRYRGGQTAGHHWSTKWVHWAAAALLAYAGIINGEVSGALYSASAMQTTTIVGIVMAALYAYLWFWVRGPGRGSRLLADAPSWERWLANTVHVGLYLGIAAALLSGFAMAYWASTDLVVFAPAHRILQMSARFDAMRDFHAFSAGVVGWLFGLHLVGALWHRIVRRDGVMQSISLLKPGATA